MNRLPFHLPLALVVAVALLAGAAAWLSAPAYAARTVRLTAGPTGFSLEEIKADPGEELEVVLTNADLTSHGIVFELDGGRIERIDPIGLAREESLTFAAPTADGRYPYYSPAGNDRANGFEGVLVVGDAAQDGRVISVDAFNFGYNPAQIIVQPGELITVELTSTEGFHDIVFELEGDRVEASDRVSAPDMVSISFETPTEPGVYAFYCSVGNHREQGMEGVLIVGDPLRVEGSSNFAFDPDRIEARPGETMVIDFVNTGGTHDIVFELEGGQEARTSRISGGQSELLIFTAPSVPGEYTYYCSVGRHREFGMEGVLVVGEGGGGGTPTEPPPGETPTPTDIPPMDTPTPTSEPPPARFPVVASGLNSPHGIWLDAEGETALIAEGGTGDPVPRQFTPGNGDGRVQSFDMGTPWTSEGILLEGMTNSIDPGGGIVGANHAIRHDGGFGQGEEGGVLVAQAGGPGHLRPEEAAKILLVRDNGDVVLVADPLAYETANNPNGETGDEAIDSNPWRLVEGPDGAVYVVDAGANDVLKLDPTTGQLSTWAIFPALTADGGQQAIPTGLAFVDGAAYVSLLGRFFPPPNGTEGAGAVHRLVDLNGDGDMLDEGENVLHADELWLPSDLVVSPEGRLYVSSIGGPGSILHIPTGTGPVTAEAVVTGVPAISAMAFLPGGDMLASETSTPAQGAPNLRPDRIVRIPAAELEPTAALPRIFIPIAENP